MELGNRKKRDDYAERFLVCPLCNDKNACFNEIHMLFQCEKLEYARYQTGIRDYMDRMNWRSLTDLFIKFMDLEKITERLHAADEMKTEYFWLLEHRMEL